MQPYFNSLQNLISSKTSKAIVLLAVGLLSSGQLMAVVSTTYTLTDNGSTALVDPDSGAGMYHWSIDGQNQLEKQWFYFRVGNLDVAQPINSISSSILLNNNANTLVTSYANAQFSLTISYVLTGGSFGAGSADILETISVQNNSGSPLDFHLFQYSNFDLLGTPGLDSVQFLGLDSVIQKEGLFGIQEGIIQPEASFGEASLAGLGGTLDKLTTVPGYNLNNNMGPITGDVTWAFQWDYTIANGASLDVFKDKTLIVPTIPEPTSLSLIAVGLGALLTASSRRRSK